MIIFDRRTRAARAEYNAADRDLARIVAGLYAAEAPRDRALLLAQAADVCDLMASVHTAAYGPGLIAGEGGRPMAESLAAAGDLYRLAGATETDLSTATWTPTPAGDQIDDPAFRPAITWVRTGGPDRLLSVDVALDLGTGWSEAGEWRRLATTRDRDARAAILLTLHELAAERTGAQAAGALFTLADTEAALACAGSQPPANNPRWTRPVLVAAFLAGGALAVIGAFTGLGG